MIDIIPISRFLEGLYGPSVTDEEHDDQIPEIDDPDPNQLTIGNLVIYEPVNQPVNVNSSQYLLCSRQSSEINFLTSRRLNIRDTGSFFHAGSMKHIGPGSRVTRAVLHPSFAPRLIMS